MSQFSFAVVPDTTRQPAAVFTDLDTAIDWALDKYGGNGFAIRRIDVVEAEARTQA